MTHDADHGVTIRSTITIHEARRAANKLAEELPVERLCQYDARELHRAAETIERRLREAREAEDGGI
jgi:hypothetical protein